jgi:DNA-binding transcriptional ArsR family regulator
MDALTALADPTRRRIVELLARRELAVSDIAKDFSISAPAISQHLRTLRQARLLSVRGEAQRRLYRLDPAGFDEIESWLNQVRRFWGPRLDALEMELAKPSRVRVIKSRKRPRRRK